MLRWFSPLSFAAIVIALVAAAVSLLLGAPLGGVAAGFAIASSAILSVLNPSIAELARPRPLLRLEVNGTETRRRASVPRAHLPPWPIDIERIVRNEAAAARDTVPDEDHESPILRLGAAFNWGTAAMDVPSKADYARARQEFEQSVVKYEASLRAWLEAYRTVTFERSLEYAIGLAVRNRKGGAFAEAMTVQLHLPQGVCLAKEVERLDPPSRRPMYVSPRPKMRYYESRLDGIGPSWRRNDSLVGRNLLDGLLGPSIEGPAGWRTASDGALEFQIKELHGDRRIALPDLHVRADGDGPFEVSWAIFTKSARSPVRGQIVLQPPPADQDVPAFGRLGGIIRFPDAPIRIDRAETDETPGTIDVDPREEDPPLAPPPEPASSSVIERFQSAMQYSEWLDLGLDPQHDAPVATLPPP